MPDNATTDIALRGLALPALRKSGGYFRAAGKYDVAWGDVLVAILTPIGSRPGRRSFGSGLHFSLLEPQLSSNEAVVEYAVQEAVARHAPHVYVEQVQVRTNARKIQLHITFGLVSDRLTQERAVAIDRDTELMLIAENFL